MITSTILDYIQLFIHDTLFPNYMDDEIFMYFKQIEDKAIFLSKIIMHFTCLYQFKLNNLI
jgi:hypothetical protein